ncbi:MAG: twin-arginine translocase TatA/TatE family subunit, partial [Nitrospinota bacterium]
VIFVIALLVIGPKKLPELARSIGKGFGEFKRATSDLKESLELEETSADLDDYFSEAEEQEESGSADTEQPELPFGEEVSEAPSAQEEERPSPEPPEASQEEPGSNGSPEAKPL